MASRDELVRGLASSFGLSDVHTSKYNGPKYDSATGTLYCDGVSIPRHTIDKALEYYNGQMEYYRGRANQSAEAMESFLNATIAYNAICMLKDNVNSGV